MLDSKLISLLVLNETKSYSKTANILFLTQPAITSQIKSLEDEYGIKIFNKAGKDLKLTSEGEILIKHAKKLQSLYKSLESELKSQKEKIKKLKVGITSGIDSSFISMIFAKFSLNHNDANNNIEVTLLSNNITSLSKMLKLYEIDIVITDDKINDPDITSVTLDSDNLMLITSPKSHLACLPSIPIELLKSIDLVVRLPNSSTRILFDATLKSNNLSINDFNIVMELNSVSAIKNLVKNNVTNAILTNNSCINEINQNQIKTIPIENISINHETKLLFLNSFSHEKILKEIIELYSKEKNNNK